MDIEESSAPTDSSATSDIHYSIIETETGYGYEVFVEGKKRIYQPFIPNFTAKQGFSTKKDAAAVAELVVKKVERGIIPPVITLEELDSLGIVYGN